ncbi:MAG: spore coat protein, partial [Clostridia bacterium]|nr:spore coat protein [Clostridia bacterium]
MAKHLMDDKAMVSDCLASQKFLANCYNTAIMESNSSDLRRDFMAIYQDEQQSQRALFELMSARGWYQTSPAHREDVVQVRERMEQEMAG